MRRPRLRTAVPLLVIAVMSPWLVPAAAPSVQTHRAPHRKEHRPPEHVVARPEIVPRRSWKADSVTSAPPARYARRVRAAVIHHTNTPNGYDCDTVPKSIRDLYAGHALGRHWDDIGYNFLVDACGNIYEGRAGGSDRPVVAAHARGFNKGTVGIAAVGSFTEGTPVPEPMLDAIAHLVAWKLGPNGPDPRGTVTLVSTNDESRFPKGTKAVLPVVTGHTDSYATDCPGAALYDKLPEIRDRAARVQGRR
ncbi:N-acetylmuramoyl-L-alanine amidase [Wenjunlia vitaminophila]|uniref:N-acetylmuramoyl-L-alanine amidase n=1 Tax=Wenjunlia vitaminophila TaxID=76728 RepID=A0A0T6LUI7_WENVI|nr:peptidoglycan recognition protein [Wenjunlia vitaminophila]KRV49706.1 N-acetylmuramoyl-L-alanine amidase [Wenjunlia vitaminophila]